MTKEPIAYLTKSLRRWSLYRQAVREMDMMTGRELTDLGLTRNDIPRIARQAAELG